MRRFLCTTRLFFPLLLLFVLTAPAVVDAESLAQVSGSSGRRKLLLFAKDPATWAIVKGGASGQLIYREASGEFTLHALGLSPHAEYLLIRYADAPPYGEILVKGASDAGGNLEIAGIWHNWTKKFWLLPAGDVSGEVGGVGTLRAWRPERYLFEEKSLGLACVCPEAEEP